MMLHWFLPIFRLLGGMDLLEQVAWSISLISFATRLSHLASCGRVIWITSLTTFLHSFHLWEGWIHTSRITIFVPLLRLQTALVSLPHAVVKVLTSDVTRWSRQLAFLATLWIIRILPTYSMTPPSSPRLTTLSQVIPIAFCLNLLSWDLRSPLLLLTMSPCTLSMTRQSLRLRVPNTLRRLFLHDPTSLWTVAKHIVWFCRPRIAPPPPPSPALLQSRSLDSGRVPCLPWHLIRSTTR